MNSLMLRECIEAAIHVAGYKLVVREYVEDSQTPGFLGQIAGRTSHELREVVVGTHGCDDDEIARRLAHELLHVVDPAWVCGSRSPLSGIEANVDPKDVREALGESIRETMGPDEWFMLHRADAEYEAIRLIKNMSARGYTLSPENARKIILRKVAEEYHQEHHLQVNTPHTAKPAFSTCEAEICAEVRAVLERRS